MTGRSKLLAITRAPSQTLGACELTYVERTPIDVQLARRQHAAYEDALRSLEVEVLHLEPREEWPDSVFVEDAAVVLDEIAVIARPGVPSREAEGQALTEPLARFRSVLCLEAPASLDGGDVLRLRRSLYVGRSARTNEEGVRQLRALVEPLGYKVEAVDMRGCLHLQSACTAVGDGWLLADAERIDVGAFRAERVLRVPSEERDAANTLGIGDAAILPTGYPRTAALLRDAGLRTIELDLSEFQKAEGGPTCLSLLFTAR